jgi:hypothetical protein
VLPAAARVAAVDVALAVQAQQVVVAALVPRRHPSQF